MLNCLSLQLLQTRMLLIDNKAVLPVEIKRGLSVRTGLKEDFVAVVLFGDLGCFLKQLRRIAALSVVFVRYHILDNREGPYIVRKAAYHSHLHRRHCLAVFLGHKNVVVSVLRILVQKSSPLIHVLLFFRRILRKILEIQYLQILCILCRSFSNF